MLSKKKISLLVLTTLALTACSQPSTSLSITTPSHTTTGTTSTATTPSTNSGSNEVEVDKSIDGLLNAIQDYYASGIFDVTYNIKLDQTEASTPSDATDSSDKIVTDVYTDKYVWIDGEQAGYALLDSSNFSWNYESDNSVFQFLKEGSSYQLASPLLSIDSNSQSYVPVTDLTSFSGFEYLFDDGNFILDDGYFIDGEEEDTYTTTNPDVLSAFKRFAQDSSDNTIDSAILHMTDRGGISFELKAGDASVINGEIYNIDKAGNKSIDSWISSFQMPSNQITKEQISNILNVEDDSQSNLLAKSTVSLEYLDEQQTESETMGSAILSYSPTIRVMNANYESIPSYQLTFVNENGNTASLQRSALDGSVSYKALSPATAWSKGFVGNVNLFSLLKQNIQNIVSSQSGDGEYFLFSPDADSFLYALTMTSASLIGSFSQVKFTVKNGKVIALDALGSAGYNQAGRFVRFVVHTDFSPDPITQPVDGFAFYKDRNDSRIQNYSEESLSAQEKKDNEQIAQSFSYLKGDTAKSFTAMGFVTSAPIPNPDEWDKTNIPFKGSDVQTGKAPMQFNAYRYDKDSKISINSLVSSRFINKAFRDYNYQMTKGYQEINGKLYPIRINGPEEDIANSTQKVGKAQVIGDAVTNTTSIIDKIAVDNSSIAGESVILKATPLVFKIDENGDYVLKDPKNTTDIANYFFLNSAYDSPDGGQIKVVPYKNDNEHKIHYITYQTTDSDGMLYYNYIYFNYEANTWFPYDITPVDATTFKGYTAPTNWKEENSYLYSLLTQFLGQEVADKLPYDYEYLKDFSGNLERDPYDIQGANGTPNDGTERLSIVNFDGEPIDLSQNPDAAKNYFKEIDTKMKKDLPEFKEVATQTATTKAYTNGKVTLTFSDMTSEGAAVLKVTKGTNN